MPRPTAAPLVALALAVAVAPAPGQEAPALRVELADGTILVGAPIAPVEVALDGPTGLSTFELGAIDDLRISSLRASDVEDEAAAIAALVEGLGADEYAEREAATAALLARPAWTAGLLRPYLDDPDIEVRGRVEAILGSRSASSEAPGDPRDLIATGGTTRRGWLRPTRFALRTTTGDEAIDLLAIRSLRPAGRPSTRLPRDEWPPPAPTAEALPIAAGEVAVVLDLVDGSRRIGSLPAVGTLVDVDLADVRSVSATDGTLEARAIDGRRFEARACGPDLDLTTAAGGRRIPLAALERLAVGTIEEMAPAIADLIADLSDRDRPARRMWVSINDQPANPWNTGNGKAMTWIVKSAEDDRCLVGGDGASDAYKGDTPIGTELPILCLRKTGAAAPAGLALSYNCGWSGGQVALTRPIRGDRLTSLEEANRIVESELGEGWRMAEFHDGGGGWNWWASWR